MVLSPRVVTRLNACMRKTEALGALGSSFLVGLFCPLCPLFARDNTFVIMMTNGDHITCEIETLSTGDLQSLLW
jgi:hypothetical protein